MFQRQWQPYEYNFYLPVIYREKLEWAQSRVEVKTMLCSELFVKRKKTTRQNESSFNRKSFAAIKAYEERLKTVIYICVSQRREQRVVTRVQTVVMDAKSM